MSCLRLFNPGRHFYLAAHQKSERNDYPSRVGHMELTENWMKLVFETIIFKNKKLQRPKLLALD